MDCIESGNCPAAAALSVETPPFQPGSPCLRRAVVKWTGMYLFGFVVLLGGVLAALWKLGFLARVGTTWTLIGCAIAIGLGIMIAVSNSGAKENIEINRK